MKKIQTIRVATSSYFLNKSFCREVCGMTVSDRSISIRTDDSWGSVEFDFFSAMNKIIFEKYNNLTMVHTHPDGVNGMSSIDMNMATGWPLALGIPIRYVILTSELYLEYYLTREGNKTLMPKVHEYPISDIDSFCEGHFVTFCRMLYGLSTCNNEIDGVELSNDFNKSFFDTEI
jgi:proteasome lid subunit RPN8/RPN11